LFYKGVNVGPRHWGEEYWVKVFGSRVLRRILGPRGDDVTGEKRKFSNAEFNNLYSSPNIFRVKKSRRLGLAGHLASTGEEKRLYRLLVGNLRESYLLEDTDLDRRTVLIWILKQWDVGVWTRST
jgi:hypothetical protein